MFRLMWIGAWHVVVVGGLAAIAAGQPATKNPTTTGDKTAVLLVEGQVFDFVGGGVSGAMVRLVGAGNGPAAGDNPTTGANQIIATTRTNDYGDFRITGDHKLTGSAQVIITKTFFKTATIDVTLSPGGPPPFVEHRMQGAVVMTGTVVDSRKKTPIDKAEVTLEAAYDKWTARTTSDGTFTIEGLAPGAARLTVRADGFADVTQPIEHLEEPVLRIVPMLPERIVHLIVVDEAGQPVARVSVECVGRPDGDYHQTLTNAEGRADIRGINQQTEALAIRLSSFSYVSDLDFDRALSLPADQAESTHRLVMKLAARLRGVVRDQRTHKPLSGARILVGTVASDQAPRAFSEFDGTFEVSGAPPGRVVLTVHRAGYAPQLVETEAQIGAEKSIEITLSPGREVTGRVTDPDGHSLSGVHVGTSKWRGYDTLGLQALTDSNGRFSFIDAPADTFAVSLYLPGYQPRVDQPIIPASTGTPTTADFTLTPDPNRPQPGDRPLVGGDAPSPSVTTLDGTAIKLARKNGKLWIIDFWATWCRPCVAEIPRLVDLHKRIGGRQDVEMVSVSLDNDPSKVRRFARDRHMDWLHVCGPDSGAQQAADAYRVYGIPSIYLIGPDGKILVADGSAAQVAARVSQYLDDHEK